jgi:molybdate transport system substrate-binding protein
VKRILIALVLCIVAAPLAAAEITVYAAASLVDALTAVGEAYNGSGKDSVRFSFAASSTLARQIEQGAPAALFISADEDWMNYLSEKNLLVAETRSVLLGNRLVLITPADRPSKVEIKSGFDLATLLGDGRLAVGDPAGVPAGKYAREALTTLGVWEVAQSRLLNAESVRVALLYVERGEARAGIVYATDAMSSKTVAIAGTFPESSHKPIVYPVAILRDHDSAASRAFESYLHGPQARAIFERYGFSVR